MSIEEKLALFKADIKEGILTAESIFTKHIIDSKSYYFESGNTKASEDSIKLIISKAFNIDHNLVKIVGSGKLGFSLKPENLFTHFDAKFNFTKVNNHKSDIDIAIVSNELYENIGLKLYNFTLGYKQKWNKNEYYNEINKSPFDYPLCYIYFEYFTKGWFRPDLKPQGFDFCVKGKYEILKFKLYEKLKRKASIAIYQNDFYFKDYHLNNIKNIMYKLNTETL